MKALLAIATASIPLLFDWIPRHTITANQYINVTTQPKELCSFLRLLVSVCLLCSLSLSLSFCKTSEASDYPPAPKHGNFLQVLQERSHIPRVEGFPSEWPTSSRVHQVRGPVRFQKRYKQLVHQWHKKKGIFSRQCISNIQGRATNLVCVLGVFLEVATRTMFSISALNVKTECIRRSTTPQKRRSSS